jgi:DNA-binding transcriptional ArsR family regulator
MLNLLSGAWTTQAITAAARLGIADHLGDQVVCAAELARASGTHPDRLRRLLRFLAELGIVAEEEDDSYRLTELGALLRSDAAGSIRDVARIYGGEFYSAFGALDQTIRTGSHAFGLVFDASPWQYFADHPEVGRVFDAAMTALTTVFGPVAATTIDVSTSQVVVDIGGGVGDLLAHFLAANRHLKGALLDRPQVIENARQRLRAFEDRCTLVAGDFFTEVPSVGDLYLLSRILHDWDDDRCLSILAGCRAALPDNGTLVVIERPIPDDGDGRLACAFDLHMMVNTVDGRERTVSEYRALLSRAGFDLEQTHELPLGMAALIARPQRP